MAISRYNERAVTILSFVAEFSPPPPGSNMKVIGQHAIHKILRMPPNSLSCDLLRYLGCFSNIAPVCLEDYITACAYRFALSERDYLLDLSHRIRNEVGDN